MRIPLLFSRSNNHRIFIQNAHFLNCFSSTSLHSGFNPFLLHWETVKNLSGCSNFWKNCCLGMCTWANGLEMAFKESKIWGNTGRRYHPSPFPVLVRFFPLDFLRGLVVLSIPISLFRHQSSRMKKEKIFPSWCYVPSRAFSYWDSAVRTERFSRFSLPFLFHTPSVVLVLIYISLNWKISQFILFLLY